MWAAIDFETSGINKYACKMDRICILKFDINTGEQLCAPADYGWRYGNDPVPSIKQELVGCDALVAHNAGFELHLLRRLGILPKCPVHDTYQMAKHYRNDLEDYDLKSLAKLYFEDEYAPLTKIKEWIRACNKGRVRSEHIDFDLTRVDDVLVHEYCIHDVRVTARLAHMLYPHVCDIPAYQQDTDLIKLVERIENNGITVDRKFYQRFVRNGKKRIKYNLRGAADDLGDDIQEDEKPTGHALRRHLLRRGERSVTAKGMVRADEITLRKHRSSAAVRHIMRVRTDQKIVSTYAENILACSRNGKFHPGLNQSRAVTRRFTASGMYGDDGATARGQVQNFPRGSGIRTGIVVPEGFKFVKLDLASIEARLASHAMSVFFDFGYYCKKYKEDPKFNMYLHVIENHTKHGKVSKKDPIYTVYKHGCLGIQYGVGIDTFHRTMVDTFQLPYSHRECEDIYNTIRRECPEFSRLQKVVGSIIQSQGYVEDDFGARYYVNADECYKGVNYYCQGCAGNILKWWMLETDRLVKGSRDYVFNLVHDEQDMAIWNDLDAPSRVRKYCDVLKKLTIFDLPIVAEASPLVNNWAEAG